MEQTERVGQLSDHPVDRGAVFAAGTALPRGVGTTIAPQSADGQCSCGCSGSSKAGDDGAVNHSYVYALGRIEPRFATLGVEKEFAQATGRAGTAGLSDQQALHAVLSKRENHYLARQLCWVFS